MDLPLAQVARGYILNSSMRAKKDLEDNDNWITYIQRIYEKVSGNVLVTVTIIYIYSHIYSKVFYCFCLYIHFFLSIDLCIINSIDLYIAKEDDKLFKVRRSCDVERRLSEWGRQCRYHSKLISK